MAKLTGVSVRTIQYYDKIGLLKPTTKSNSGYRLYNDGKLFQLQQILFYKEAGLTLAEIREALLVDSSDNQKKLLKQKILLLEKKMEIEKMITKVDLMLEAGTDMDFEAYKKTLATKIPENTALEDKEAILNAITPDQLETIKLVWGIDQFFEFLNRDSPMQKNMDSFILKGNQLVEKLLDSTDPEIQTTLITEWMNLIVKYTQLDLLTVVSSMKVSYSSHQLTINSVNGKFGAQANEKLAQLLTDYEKHML